MHVYLQMHGQDFSRCETCRLACVRFFRRRVSGPRTGGERKTKAAIEMDRRFES